MSWKLSAWALWVGYGVMNCLKLLMLLECVALPVLPQQWSLHHQCPNKVKLPLSTPHKGKVGASWCSGEIFDYQPKGWLFESRPTPWVLPFFKLLHTVSTGKATQGELLVHQMYDRIVINSEEHLGALDCVSSCPISVIVKHCTFQRVLHCPFVEGIDHIWAQICNFLPRYGQIVNSLHTSIPGTADPSGGT